MGKPKSNTTATGTSSNTQPIKVPLKAKQVAAAAATGNNKKGLVQQQGKKKEKNLNQELMTLVEDTNKLTGTRNRRSRGEIGEGLVTEKELRFMCQVAGMPRVGHVIFPLLRKAIAKLVCEAVQDLPTVMEYFHAKKVMPRHVHFVLRVPKKYKRVYSAVIEKHPQEASRASTKKE